MGRKLKVNSTIEEPSHYFDNNEKGVIYSQTDNTINAIIPTEEESFESKCKQAAEKYINNCKKFEIKIDANVVISLMTGWNILHPTKESFSEGSMLPLRDILDHNDHITKINLSSVAMHYSRYRYAGNGNSNARILKEIISSNRSIEVLDVSNTGLDDGDFLFFNS